nr:C40 family peptidase [Pseudomonas sp. TH49]
MIGTPYSWGGTSGTKGFDCSGLLVYLFRSEGGMEIPRTTVSMINEGYLSVSRRYLQPGDVVFFDNKGRGQVDHVGLYIGDNQFVHAPRTGTSIRIDSLGNQYWSQRYFGGGVVLMKTHLHEADDCSTEHCLFYVSVFWDRFPLLVCRRL